MKPDTPDKIAYSINEACDATSLRRTKLYSLIDNGDLEAVRVGGRTLIPADSLRALVDRAQPISGSKSKD